jgi:hypothetical protein
MGSSNGTKVNGSVVKKQRLTDGDAVSLGPVVFNFSATSLEAPDGEPNVADQSTRIFDLDRDGRPKTKNRGEALVPVGAAKEEIQQMQKSATRTLPAVSKPRVSGPRSVPAVANAARAGGLSAAERARIRRENPGMLGSLKLFWAEASKGVRTAVIGAGGLFVAGLIGLAFYMVASDNGGPKAGPEPHVLGRKPIEASFGLGDGVTYNRPDMKVFDFEFRSATDAVVLLHYQSRDISDGEVVVTVNGTDVGKVPADTLSSLEVSHELVIPPQALKKAQNNKIIFDNVHNPPGDDPWRIWNVWIEAIPLPQESPDDLKRDADLAYKRAEKRWEDKDIGAENRYEAWKEFRNAWLLLEAHPNPKPELYQLSKIKIRETQQELDRFCSQLMLEAEGDYNRKDWNAARATLDHVKDFFPANDQPCPLRAEQKRTEWGL